MRHPFATSLSDLQIIGQMHSEGFIHPTLKHPRESVYALSYATKIDPMTILKMPYNIFSEWQAYVIGRQTNV